MTTASIQVVPVGDSSVTAIMRDGTVWVSVRRVCAVLGLDPANQRKMLADKPWAKTSVFNVVGDDGRRQEAYMLALKSLPMWLSNINHNKVDEAVAKRLICFQLEAHDALAAHFGMPGCEVKITSHPSGGSSGSGGVPSVAAAGGSGTTLQMLQLFDALSGAIRAQVAEVAEVREMATANTRMLSEAQARVEIAEARARDAMAIADRAIANSTMAREDRRRCDAAVRVVTKACQAWAGNTGESYRDIYSKLRRALGLRSTAHGGKSLGESKLSASQVLVLAHTATSLGVAGVGAARIRAILDGVDDPTRPGAIDAEVTSLSTVAARSADRTAP